MTAPRISTATTTAAPLDEKPQYAAPKVDALEFVDKMSAIEDRVLKQIDYDGFVAYYNENRKRGEAEAFEIIVKYLVEFMQGGEDYIRVGRQEVPRALALKRFYELDDAHIEFAVKRFTGATQRIHNPKAYILAMLYNADNDMRAKAFNEARALE